VLGRSEEQLSSGKYVASFIVDPSGEFIPAELGAEALDSKKVVVIIDEPSKRIYLWLGKASSQNNKMGARRTVKSIPTFGLRKKGIEFPLGRDCTIVEIEESRAESDSATRTNLADLSTLFKRPHIKRSAGIWRVEDVSPAETGEFKTDAKILERRMQYEMSHLEREAMTKNKKGKQEESSK
jgi:hypothetical protein